MLLWNAVAVAALLTAEPSIITPPITADDTPAKNVVWIQPLASTPGRAAVGFERALGKGASLHVNVLGGFAAVDVTDVNTRVRTVVNEGIALVGIGVRAFPLGAAPFGPWVGGQVRAGVSAGNLSFTTADQLTTELKYASFVGEGELQAGASLSLYRGLAVHGSIGLRGTYQRYLDGMVGDSLQFGVGTWLGLGYAF
jgi:hypothetical protein